MSNETKIRLSRKEATALLVDSLKDVPLPFYYKGGWPQVLSDFGCVCTASVFNMAVQGRKLLEVKKD